ncbi:MAG: phage holin family protein [Polyangiaceae bacterium]
MTEPPIVDHALEPSSTVEIAKQALAEAKELIELEVRLAKVEAIAELKRLRSAAIGAGIATALTLLGLGALLLSLVLALGASALTALGVASLLLLGAMLSGAYAYSRLPKAPLDQTRERLKDDLKRLREHAI